MYENISVFHSSIRIEDSKIIYFDPYKIDDECHDADIVFITHEHFDHYSREDIEKVKNETTVFVFQEKIKNKIDYKNSVFVLPNENYEVQGISFMTIPAYNINKKFHPLNNNWLGYLVNLNNTKYYIAGDTDITEENKAVKCDIAFLPCGGTYTMDYKESAELANIIKPNVVIPTHYGSVVGSKDDGKKMIALLEDGISGVLLIK